MEDVSFPFNDKREKHGTSRLTGQRRAPQLGASKSLNLPRGLYVRHTSIQWKSTVAIQGGGLSPDAKRDLNSEGVQSVAQDQRAYRLIYPDASQNH